MTRALTLALAVAAIAVALAACGKQGGLERPGPLWGDKAKADYAAQQQKAAAARAKTSQTNQIEPLPDDNAANATQP
jgi:predicted small lipoprotein YifL